MGSDTVHRRARIAAAALVVVAAILLNVVVRERFPPATQFDKYPVAADQYRRGQLSAERVRDFSPLYLGLFLAARGLTEDPARTVVALQILAVAAAAAMLFLAVLQRAGLLVALAAAGSLLLNPSVLLYTQVLEPEILLLLGLLGFAFFACRESHAARLVSGAFFAFCVFTRPTFLGLAVLVPLWLRFREPGRRTWAVQAGLFLLPAVLAFAFLALRSASEGESFPLVMNPGFVFYEGNNPLAGALGMVCPPAVYDAGNDFPEEVDFQHAIYREAARAEAGRRLTVGAVNRRWTGKALAFIVDEPGQFLRRIPTRVAAYLGEHRRHDLMAVVAHDVSLQKAHVPFFPFSAVSALALAGLVLSAASWRRDMPFLLVWITQLAVVAAAYHPPDRHRVALVPFFVFLAAVATSWAVRNRRHRPLLLAGVLPLTLLLSFRTDEMREIDHIWLAHLEADRLRREAGRLMGRGDAEGAAQAVAEALVRTPWMADGIRPAGLGFGPEGLGGRAVAAARSIPAVDASTRFDRALLLLLAGRLDEAERGFLDLLGEGHQFARLYDGSSRPEFYLGLVAAARGDRPLAVARIDAALARAPGDPFALAWRVALTGSAEHRRRLERYFSAFDANFLLGKAHLQLGDGPAAVESLRAVVDVVPSYRRGRIYLAAALGMAGRSDEAATLYLDTTLARPTPVLLETGILRVFEDLTARHPESGEARYWQRYVRCSFEGCLPGPPPGR